MPSDAGLPALATAAVMRLRERVRSVAALLSTLFAILARFQETSSLLMGWVALAFVGFVLAMSVLAWLRARRYSTTSGRRAAHALRRFGEALATPSQAWTSIVGCFAILVGGLWLNHRDGLLGEALAYVGFVVLSVAGLSLFLRVRQP